MIDDDPVVTPTKYIVGRTAGVIGIDIVSLEREISRFPRGLNERLVGRR
jgi:hypothetical protein